MKSRKGIGNHNSYPAAANPNYRHGMQSKRIYRTWRGMKTRCLNPGSINYRNYGGRGISVCEKWLRFEGFLEDMSEGYTDEMTIERIDVNGNYEKSNCKWIPKYLQGFNMTRSLIVNYKGKYRNLKELTNELGLKYSTVYSRIYTYGYSVEDALRKGIYRANRYKKEFLSQLL